MERTPKIPVRLLMLAATPSAISLPVLWGVPGGGALALSLFFPSILFLGLISAAWGCVSEAWFR